MRYGDIVLHRNGGRFFVLSCTAHEVEVRNPVRGAAPLLFDKGEVTLYMRAR